MRNLVLIGGAALAMLAAAWWVASPDAPETAAKVAESPENPAFRGDRAPIGSAAAKPAEQLATLLYELARRDPDGDRGHAAADELARWLAAQPGREAALARWLRGRGGKYDDGDPWARAALAALGAAGTQEARRALRGIGEDRALSDASRLHAWMNLAKADQLSAEDVAAVLAQAHDRAPSPGAQTSMVAGGAIALLGPLCRSDKVADAAARQQALGALKAVLREPGDEHYLVSAVNGAAVSAEAGFLDLLTPLASHASADVRAAVAAATGRLGAASAPWVQSWWQKEPSGAVRAALIDAIGADSATVAAWKRSLAKALAHEQQQPVARRLVQVLGPMASAGDPVAQRALSGRFVAETRKGGAADPAILRAIGQHMGAAALAGGLAKEGQP